jgi:predicted deacylase
MFGASMVQTSSRITSTIDFDREGRQSTCLRAPLSRNLSAWGTIEIPIFVVKNGKGPTVLFTGGIHGDEYEGPIAISRLAQMLDPSEIKGRVIMMPAVNIPAVLNDTRLSPVDQRDMNRCFPGEPKGTFSEMLAHFLESVVLPHADVSVDLHSAGHSMEAVPSTNMHYPPDAGMRARTMAAAAAFGAPYNVVFWGVDESATFTSAVERRGILSLGTELGGWGRVSIEGVRIAERGLRNILKHFGVVEDTSETGQRDISPGTRHMMVRDPSCYVFAPSSGLFEPYHLAGAEVVEGESAGQLHFVEEVDRRSLDLRYKRSGTIWMAAGPGRVQRGDVVAVTMSEYDETDWALP